MWEGLKEAKTAETLNTVHDNKKTTPHFNAGLQLTTIFSVDLSANLLTSRLID